MENIQNEAAREVYNESWSEFLSKSADSADEQPGTDSEPDDTDDAEEIEDAQDEALEDDSEDTEEPDADEPEPEVDPDIEMGEGKKAVKMSELKAGYMRQSDYTKKTQELATQRAEVDSMRESLKDAQGFKDHMEANPWLWEQVNRALTEFNEVGILPLDEVLQDAQYGKYVNYLMAENTQLKKQLEGVSSEYEGVKMYSSMQSLRNDLKADYGDLVTDDYMNTLQERAKSENLSLETLKEIAEGQLAKQSLGKNKKDVKAATKKAEAAAIQRLAETKRNAPMSASTTGARPSRPSANPSGRKESWSDILGGMFND